MRTAHEFITDVTGLSYDLHIGLMPYSIQKFEHLSAHILISRQLNQMDLSKPLNAVSETQHKILCFSNKVIICPLPQIAATYQNSRNSSAS